MMFRLVWPGQTAWRLLTLPVAALAGMVAPSLAPALPPAPVSPVSHWTIDHVRRSALIVGPSQRGEGAAPVILVFHGHGGTMDNMARREFQRYWAEAVVVYPQGLATATARDPEGRQSGWQQRIGDHHDRDLKFVDAILQMLREQYRIDTHRIFATGHSNGGGFTYLLWAARGNQLAAIAVSAGSSRSLRQGTDLQPLPVMHIAGEQDQVVAFAAQQRTMMAIRHHNRCGSAGEPWARLGTLVGTLYRSPIGAACIAVVHPGAHRYPQEAPELIVRFFQEQSQLAAKSPPSRQRRGP